MISDEQVLNDMRPEFSTDKHVVRQVDGWLRLQRILRNLPSHWSLRHLSSVGQGVMITVFERDPGAPEPGDFDHFPE